VFLQGGAAADALIPRLLGLEIGNISCSLKPFALVVALPAVTLLDGHESTGDNSGAGAGRKLSIPVSPFSAGGSGTPSSPPFPASAPAPPAYVESDALYWLGLLSRGTFKALLSSVHQLALLSDRGATQLATDLEYLVNVLSALGLQMPPLILKLALWLQWSEATMQTKLAEGSAGEWRLDELQPEDKQMLRHVIHCRRFKGIETDARIQAKLNQ